MILPTTNRTCSPFNGGFLETYFLINLSDFNSTICGQICFTDFRRIHRRCPVKKGVLSVRVSFLIKLQASGRLFYRTPPGDCFYNSFTLMNLSREYSLFMQCCKARIHNLQRYKNINTNQKTCWQHFKGKIFEVTSIPY